MTLLSRNKLVRYDYKPNTVPVSRKVVDKGNIYNAYVNRKVTPLVLVNLLQFLHQQRGYILPRESYTYTREAKKLLEKYGKEKSIKLLIEAAKVANHSFSFKFVNKLGEQIYGQNTNST